MDLNSLPSIFVNFCGIKALSKMRLLTEFYGIIARLKAIDLAEPWTLSAKYLMNRHRVSVQGRP